MLQTKTNCTEKKNQNIIMQQTVHEKQMKPIQQCKQTQNLCCQGEIADKENKSQNFSDAVCIKTVMAMRNIYIYIYRSQRIK